MKSCIKCNIDKELSEFHLDCRRNDGKYPYCKDCRRKLTNSKKLTHRIIGEFNGMVVVDSSRYPRILTPDGSFRVHRYVMEHHLGRKLERGEIVHHIDGNKKNWNIDNLIVMRDFNHRSMESHHRMGYKPTIICTTCGKMRSYSNYVFNSGHVKVDRYQCSKCYYKDGGATGRRNKIGS